MPRFHFHLQVYDQDREIVHEVYQTDGLGTVEDDLRRALDTVAEYDLDLEDEGE